MMFEAVEVGRKVTKPHYKEREPDIHTRLLESQRALKAAGIPLLVIVAGTETAGKANVVRQLNTWFDTRGVQTHSFWDVTDEERQRPYYWRFWRRLPPRGEIGVMFGSWYTQPIIDHALGAMDNGDFDQVMGRNRRLERMLSQDGMLIVKLWFHLSSDEQRKRLKKQAKLRQDPLFKMQKQFAKRYGAFIASAERAIRQTDLAESPWHLIEATDWRYRDLSVGEVLIEAIEERLAQHANGRSELSHSVTPIQVAGESTSILDHVDKDLALPKKTYHQRLGELQQELQQLSWELHAQRRLVVGLFEGWDAAGKGGAIRRLVSALDPRLYRVISIAAPTDEELAHHYLWRFWRHLPARGRMTLYDRSWYGRVLVERVEGFATDGEWHRAYWEINDFEEQLCGHGVVLLKYWIHITADEQLRRFKEREKTPWKQHKITDEDWRNREKWVDYEAAVNEMIARTSTEFAPWSLVPGNDKRYARVFVLEQAVKAARKALASG